MQSSAPELTDLSKEPAQTFDEDARKPGTFAANCLLARRLAERGVRFIQLYHRDWNHHGRLPQDLPKRCRETDQASAALILDLRQRGMLDVTLVVWGGEIRPHRLLSGPVDGQRIWPRPSPAVLHHLDGRRWHQARHHLG